MDLSLVCMKLADHWQRAARETINEELKVCYFSRAAQYLELAALDHDRPQATNANVRTLP